jgi:FKBP-type peptidyl-prolyl cis-trans isomerase SlyD
MPIAADCVVSFAYTLKDDEGNIIDKGDKEAPLTYLHGHKNLIPGIEEALLGKNVGDSFDASIPPEKGYGERDPNLDLALDKSQFPEEHPSQLAPGVQFQGPHPEKDSESMVYTVHHLEGDKVYVSGNHPLAGMQLHFAIEVLEVREATAEELEHGHVHGAGGHQH